ncbi:MULTISPECIES: hypothetical protein [Priestia]|uniref:hypothetical protein n=1 Tax=Priestia TaxID=2800373 RepID=UPI00232E95D3|nr:hypothetical protein [Priestia sp. AB]MDC0705898.1 hypothetical protein [Priestia sp. AB]
MAIGRERAARSILDQSGLRNRNPDNATFDEKETKPRASNFEKVPTPREGSTRTARMAEEYRAEYKRVNRREQFLQDTIDLLINCNNKQSVEELKELINLAKERLIMYKGK